MVVPIKFHSMKSAAAWHAGFLAMVPIIRQYAMGAFGHLNPEARQDLVQETICNAMLAYLRLFQRGRISLAYPTVLAKYGIAQVKDGRRVGDRLNVHDISSAYCQRRKKVTVERLDHFDEEENQWKEAVVVDTRRPPVPDIVAFRCDFADWLRPACPGATAASPSPWPSATAPATWPSGSRCVRAA